MLHPSTPADGAAAQWRAAAPRVRHLADTMDKHESLAARLFNDLRCLVVVRADVYHSCHYSNKTIFMCQQRPPSHAFLSGVVILAASCSKTRISLAFRRTTPCQIGISVSHDLQWISLFLKPDTCSLLIIRNVWVRNWSHGRRVQPAHHPIP